MFIIQATVVSHVFENFNYPLGTEIQGWGGGVLGLNSILLLCYFPLVHIESEISSDFVEKRVKLFLTVFIEENILDLLS
jgi:hypothetical protein